MSTLGTRRLVGGLGLLLAALLVSGYLGRAEFASLFTALLELLR